MMLLNVFVYASKAKFSGVAMIAVTKAGVKAGLNFGFEKTHRFTAYVLSRPATILNPLLFVSSYYMTLFS